ncbi:MAG: ATP-dependent DNA ligase [Saprospiraceae bacterium]|nr:ATP-dependent DNA ligase [Saprospiraceae bacterium]
MKQFAQLFRALDQTTKTKAKINALVDYFSYAEDPDKVWAIALFSHRRPKRTVTTTLLREWSAEAGGLPLWLFEESYHIVGDLAETIALITPNPTQDSNKSLTDWIAVIMDLKDKEEIVKKEVITNAWLSLDQDERFLFNKLITGGFRIGVSQKTVINALSKFSGVEESKITHRLMGNWDPTTITFEELVLQSNPTEDLSRPYPFYLAYALETDLEKLGLPEEWSAERKWDGIRGQLILRQNEIYLWSRGEELVTAKFPELGTLKGRNDKDVVIDGEILPFKDGKILNFNTLQTRIGRKNVTKKHLTEAPIIIKAYDILEYNGEDIREQSLVERRELLQQVVNEIDSPRLVFSESVVFENWEQLAEERSKSRAHLSEGLMLKKKDSPYKSGRKKGGWWKWKIDPLTIDAVMIYAQRGHGRRANLYTDFTFAVQDGERLVPFTKAYSGLTDVEFKEITQFVKKNTRERFGPVSSVHPELVFEIAFEGIAKSTRHKSGVALRFPRIKRWRRDKPKEEINTLADLNEMLVRYEGGEA